jgi:DNA-binding MarR family transcriptional regulator
VVAVSEAAFDELIHAPLRLQICAMLAPVQSLPFADIRDSLHISDSVLSKHLSALAEAGYVEVSRVRANSRSRRQVTLTKPGRTALRGHLAALQAIVAAAEADPDGERPMLARIHANEPGGPPPSTLAPRRTRDSTPHPIRPASK